MFQFVILWRVLSFLRNQQSLIWCALCAACVGLAPCFRTTRARDRCVAQRVVRLLRDNNDPVFQVYTFQTTTTTGGDEGVRLWVDGQLLVDAWATSRLRRMPRPLRLPHALAVFPFIPIRWCSPWRTRCKNLKFVSTRQHSFTTLCSYDVKLDFKDHTSTATIKLEWKHSLDATAFTAIPSERLASRCASPACVCCVGR